MNSSVGTNTATDITVSPPNPVDDATLADPLHDAPLSPCDDVKTILMSHGSEYAELNRELDPIVERLTCRFDKVDPRIVRLVVRQCAAMFEHARVKSYVRILTERRARERLEHLNISACEFAITARPRNVIPPSTRDAGVSNSTG